MRSRDVTIPLALWMCAAVCAHFLFGTGGLVVGQMHDDRTELWRLSHEASSLAQRSEETFEVSLGDPGDDKEDKKDELTRPPPPKPIEQPRPSPTAPQAPAVRPPPPKAPPETDKVVVVDKNDTEKKPLVLPEDPLKDRRLAVRQHAKANQQDNPEAKFIADEANHVEKETAASQTSHDRDDENPTIGGNHSGSESRPGDSDKTRIAESDEHPGQKNRAPGEKGTDFDVVHEPKLPKPTPTAAAASATAKQEPTGSERRPPAPGQSPRPDTQSQPAPQRTAVASPDVESAPGAGWTFNPARPAGAPGATPQPTAGAGNPAVPGARLWSLPGLGQKSSAGAMNTNLNPSQIASVVGSDNLRKLREADGERRKSEHRGSFVASNFERWRTAIENYVTSVREGNQTALNAAAVPFASYLNGMHNRIHPIFAESFLESLESLPTHHPMNDRHLVTKLEIVLTKEGRLKKMGVVKTSGITAFDIAALDSVDRAQPFGPAPTAIVSPDGNVYLWWEFHRDEVYACSTQNARPIILNTPGQQNEEPAQPPQLPAHPNPGQERPPPPGRNDAREGALRHPPRLPIAAERSAGSKRVG